MVVLILKNLLRRKGRTILTIAGVSIGVAAIVALGAMAEGFEASYNSMLSGSQSDYVISQPDAFDISLSSVDEELGDKLEAMSEVEAVSGMLEGFVQAEGIPYFFVFGYPEDSYILNRFQIVDGDPLDAPRSSRGQGKPLLLGSAVAETLEKSPGDTVRIGESVYRVVGIYETGEAFEDSAAVLPMREAQDLLGKTRQVSLFYVQLKDPGLGDRFAERVERVYSDISLATTGDFADKQLMGDMLKGYTWGIAGLAIIIGGVGMMNAQLMAVTERTREIGVLKAVGWTSRRILLMILGESLIVCLVGGFTGVLLGWLTLTVFSDAVQFFGTTANDISVGLLVQAFFVVVLMGLVAGLYPAWRASRLQPIEAIRYEGGSSGSEVRRFPVGGMAVQSVWQRSTRSLLTLLAIALTVGAIMALEGIIAGAAEIIGDIAFSSDVEIMVRQADVADTSLSALDQRIGEQIAALPEVENVSGMSLTAVMLTDPTGFFILEGFSPQGYAIRRFNIVEGDRITGNHQIMLGRMMADMMNKEIGDTIDLSGSRYKVVGIYETGGSFEEMGGVVTLRDIQSFTGRPRKVMMYLVKVHDPDQAGTVVNVINSNLEGAHAALAGEFAEQMPDFEASNAMLDGISFLAIAVGGLVVMNTMLMAVLERTREIGVLKALGWKSRKILRMIMQESLLLGVLGGVLGVFVAFGLGALMGSIPMMGDSLSPIWTVGAFIRALSVALFLGAIGGIYPAVRATRLQPIEALRYE